MFTGIIAGTGIIQSLEPANGDLRIQINVAEGFVDGCSEGDSISVSGACLTMLEPGNNGFAADLSVETLEKTSLGARKPGDSVNLELALRTSDRLGGHMVSGHVDGLARLISRAPVARAERFEFRVEPELSRFVAAKGSVCLDGVSLTVNDVDDSNTDGGHFSVVVIPHTLKVTSLGDLAVGDEVNFEADLIARYLARLNEYDNHARSGQQETQHET